MTNEKHSLPVRLFVNFLDHWTDIALFLAGIISPISLFFFTDEAIKYWTGNLEITSASPVYQKFKYWSLIIAAICITASLIILIFHLRKQKRVSELESKLAASEAEVAQVKADLASEKQNHELIINSLFEDFYAISSGFCMSMSHELGFGTISNIHERISIYVFDYKADCFTLLSRHSENTEFNSAGHPSYRKNIGVLGKVWKNGFYYCNDFPNFDTSKNRSKYFKKANREGFTKEMVESLRMKAQLYAGWRVTDSKGKPLAVVMLEATDQERWEREYLKEYFEIEDQKLTSLFEVILPRIPEISSARKRGF